MKVPHNTKSLTFGDVNAKLSRRSYIFIMEKEKELEKELLIST